MDKQAAFDEKYKTKQDQSRDEIELPENSELMNSFGNKLVISRFSEIRFRAKTRKCFGLNGSDRITATQMFKIQP